MLTRATVIVTNPGLETDEHYAPGVYKDAQSYSKYFLSSVGGLWDKEELVILDMPTKKDLLSTVAWAGKRDYSNVIFCGHGYHAENRGETVIINRPKEETLTSELINASARELIILDCCREPHVYPYYPATKKASASVLNESLMTASAAGVRRLDPQKCKTKFFADLAISCGGNIVVEACGNGEEADDHPVNGGLYSQSLLSCAYEFALTHLEDMRLAFPNKLSIVGTHKCAQGKVGTASGGKQNPPDARKPRTLEPFFPFAVVA